MTAIEKTRTLEVEMSNGQVFQYTGVYPEVYRRFDELTEGTASLGDEEAEHGLMLALRRGDPEALGEALHNDLEPAALTLAPELEEVLDVPPDRPLVDARPAIRR